MRKHIGLILGSALMALAFAAPGFTQAVSSTAKPKALPVKVQVVLMRGEGERKINSPYSLIASSAGEASSLRIGTEVLVGTTLQQIGTQIDYTVTATDDGRFKLMLSLKGQFLSPEGLPRGFTSTNTFTFRDGESTKFTGSDDGGGAFTLDVTLTVVK